MDDQTYMLRLVMLQQQRNAAMDAVADLGAKLSVAEQALKTIVDERDVLKRRLEADTETRIFPPGDGVVGD